MTARCTICWFPDCLSKRRSIPPLTTLHGVLLRVYGMGVLLTGASGTGKSTLALGLIARGHTLVADDAVHFRQAPGGILQGQCDPLLRGHLAVRELGLLDIRTLYGASAVRYRQRLDLVIRLAPRRSPSARAQLNGRRSRQRILGRWVPVLSLSANVGHNLATLVEAACLDQRLRNRGHTASRAFAARQLKAINDKT